LYRSFIHFAPVIGPENVAKSDTPDLLMGLMEDATKGQGAEYETMDPSSRIALSVGSMFFKSPHFNRGVIELTDQSL
jgi:hypothetical protein